VAKIGARRVVIEVPENLRVPPGELEGWMRIERALRLYEEGIAGLSKWDFLELLAKKGIPVHYNKEELREDLETVKRYVRT